jgi:hypothetical protein
MLFAAMRRFVSSYDPWHGLARNFFPGITLAQVIRQWGLPPKTLPFSW